MTEIKRKFESETILALGLKLNQTTSKTGENEDKQPATKFEMEQDHQPELILTIIERIKKL